MKPIIKIFIAAAVLFLLWFFVCLYISPGNGSVVTDVSFPSGSGIRYLADELKRGGVIRSSWHFILLTRLRGEAHRLKAGEYRFDDAMTPDKILSMIVAGDVYYKKFTLPEGYSIYQAAELLERKGYFTRELFLQKCRDKNLIKILGINAESLEGYLYPATYNLVKGAGVEQLLEQMVGQFNRVYALAVDTGGRKKMSLHEVVTLASIIEKEAVSADEKQLISSVFHNRLKVGMPLQSDPTAVYGVRAFSGTVTRADVLRPSKYNTYLHRGLPPGPIGNPGRGAIHAALNPAESDYFYFVAKKDGTHHFSRTLDEHNRGVHKYLKK